MTADGTPDATLPPQPAPSASYSERDYYRRRIDELLDERIRGLLGAVGTLDKRVDAIDGKLARIFGGLAVIMVLAGIFGPTIARIVFGLPM